MSCRDWVEQAQGAMVERGLDPRDIQERERFSALFRAAHPRPRASLADVADHVDHVREVVGIDHVGLGGDFDGTDDLPEGLEDVSCYPRLVAELASRGWSAAELAKLTWGNVLRVVGEASS